MGQTPVAGQTNGDSIQLAVLALGCGLYPVLGCADCDSLHLSILFLDSLLPSSLFIASTALYNFGNEIISPGLASSSSSLETKRPSPSLAAGRLSKGS